MKKVNIYINSDVNSAKKTTGKFIYILELITDKEPVTLTGVGHLEDVTKNDIYTVALERALGRLKSECNISIYLENEYILNAINHYLPGWKERGWKNTKNEAIKNAESWQKIAEILEKHEHDVHCHEAHQYKSWMERELKKEH
ncbi:MAG: hypothetical protein MJZ37_07785 [Bacilli bacterium]|nr:hypothetical protein [Bacilli bacterium]